MENFDKNLEEELNQAVAESDLNFDLDSSETGSLAKKVPKKGAKKVVAKAAEAKSSGVAKKTQAPNLAELFYQTCKNLVGTKTREEWGRNERFVVSRLWHKDKLSLDVIGALAASELPKTVRKSPSAEKNAAS